MRRTATERRRPWPYSGERWQRRSLMKANEWRTPLRHASRRSCCACSSVRSGESIGIVAGPWDPAADPGRSAGPSVRTETSVIAAGRVRLYRQYCAS